MGINVKGTPCNTPGCRCYVNYAQQSSTTRLFTDKFYIGMYRIVHSKYFLVKLLYGTAHGQSCILMIFSIQMSSYPLSEQLCQGLVPYCNKSKKMTLFWVSYKLDKYILSSGRVKWLEIKQSYCNIKN